MQVNNLKGKDCEITASNMIIARVNIETAYYTVLSCCDQYFSDVIFENILNFVHLAAFWKAIDTYSVDSLLIIDKLERLNFIDEAINTFAESIDVVINDSNTMMINLQKCINIECSDTSCECISECCNDEYLLMKDIIYELLNNVAFDDYPSEPTDELYATIQLFKQIDSDIIIETEDNQD